MVGKVVLFISVVHVFNAGYRGNIWYGGYEEMLQVFVHLFLCFIEYAAQLHYDFCLPLYTFSNCTSLLP